MAIELSTISKKRKDPWAPLNTCVILGDSIDNSKGGYSSVACFKLGVSILHNGGVGGNTLANMLARFDTDVTPYLPDFVIIKGGTNDVGIVGYVESESLNTLNSIIDSVYNIGSVPIVVLPPTRDDANKTAILSLRNFISINCIERGVSVFDPFAISIDPQTGSWVSGWSGDGIHPSQPKAYLVGEDFATKLNNSKLKFGLNKKPTENSVGGGIFTNPLMYVERANGWAVGFPSDYFGWTATIVTDSDFLGNAQKVTASDTVSRNLTIRDLPMVDGVEYLFTMKIKINSYTGVNNTLAVFMYDTDSNVRTYLTQNLQGDGVITLVGRYLATGDTALKINVSAGSTSSGSTGAWTIDMLIGEVQAWPISQL